MYLSRRHYLEVLHPYIGKPLIKIITGQRRIGKTVFLEQLSQTFNPSQVLYINKEDKAFDVLKNDDDLYRCLENEIKKGKKYIFCDEVQLITHREKAINSVFAKHKNNIDIYLNCIFKYVIS